VEPVRRAGADARLGHQAGEREQGGQGSVADRDVVYPALRIAVEGGAPGDRLAGRVHYEPLATDWRAVAALASIETLLAQTADTWPRLKTCAHPPCGACFYDASPNQSRAWHNTKTCGNLNNLRASRTRKRSTSAAEQQ
jgi:predicted RNA-binding Zn ribbon-like protein